MRGLCLILCLLLLVSVPALAQTTTRTTAGTQTQADSGGSFLPGPAGLRVGHTSWDGVSQIHFGAHMKLGEVFPNVDLTPGIELGFGDNVTIMTLNGDLAYQFTELASHPWGFYGGGSLSLNYVNFDLPDGAEAWGVDSSDWQLGLSALAGVTRATSSGDEWMLEARFSLLDSPDWKLTLGYTFF